MLLEDVRKIALSLPETTEEPHHHMTSFRVKKKIFATAPPDNQHLHIFVGDDDRSRVTAIDPKAFETLTWGSKAAGVRVNLEHADHNLVSELLYNSWTRKAPKKLIATEGADWKPPNES